MENQVELEPITVQLTNSKINGVVISPILCDKCKSEMVLRYEKDFLNTPFYECKNLQCKKKERIKCPFCFGNVEIAQNGNLACKKDNGNCQFEIDSLDIINLLISVNRHTKNEKIPLSLKEEFDEPQKIFLNIPKYVKLGFTVLVISSGFYLFSMRNNDINNSLEANIQDSIINEEKTVIENTVEKNPVTKKIEENRYIMTPKKKSTETKMTYSGYCHAPDHKDYDMAIAYKKYNTLTECLLDGGFLPE